MIAALKRALDRRSVLDDDPESPMPPMEKPMTTLYLTGHSLGGAMAALMAVMLSVEPEYKKLFAQSFKGACTYGAPMVGSPQFANACAENTFLHRNVVRYVYRKDLVPHLPPSESDAFQHFGREFRYDRGWKKSDKPVTQTPGDLLGLIEAPLGFVASKFRLLRGIPFRFSLNDHGPQHYISAITPQKTQRVRRRLPDPGEVTPPAPLRWMRRRSGQRQAIAFVEGGDGPIAVPAGQTDPVGRVHPTGPCSQPPSGRTSR